MYCPLAESWLAYQRGATVVLQRTGDDLGCAGRSAIDQHGQGNVGRDATTTHLEGAFLGIMAQFIQHNAIAEELAGGGYRWINQSAVVVPQIQDQAGGLCLAQFLKGLQYFVVGPLGEALNVDVADVGCLIEHAPGDRGHLNLLPGDGEIERRGGGARNGECDRCANLTMEQGPHVIHSRLAGDRFGVHRQQGVSLVDPGALGRGIGIGSERHLPLCIAPQRDANSAKGTTHLVPFQFTGLGLDQDSIGVVEQPEGLVDGSVGALAR